MPCTIRVKATQKGKKFHALDCTQGVSRKDPETKFDYFNAERALAPKLKPCDHCKPLGPNWSDGR